MKTIITKEERDGLRNGANTILDNFATATSRNLEPVGRFFHSLRKTLGKQVIIAGTKIVPEPNGKKESNLGVTEESVVTSIKPDSLALPLAQAGAKVGQGLEEKGDKGEVAQ